MPLFALLAGLFQRVPHPGKKQRFALLELGLGLVTLLFVHIVAMHYLEGMDWWTSVWLTFITVATVGYGDVSAKTVWGQAATLALLVIPGIVLFSKLLSEIVDRNSVRRERQLKGAWRWPMKEHILVFNAPQNVESYMTIVVSEFVKYPEFEHSPVQVVSTKFPHGLPTRLQDMNVLLYTGSGNSDETLAAVNVSLAKVVIVLAPDPEQEDSDAATFDLVHRIRDTGSKAYIVAESIRDSNRRRIRAAGADATLRPIRAYPEIAVRAVLAPGSELVIEELFDSAGSEYRRVNVPQTTMLWKDVTMRCIESDLGTPLAYVQADGTIVINPLGSHQAEFCGLILAVLDTAKWSDEDLIRLVIKANPRH